MNLSRKHKKLKFEQLFFKVVGIKCSRQFIRWCGQHNLSFDEVRYLINDGWHLYGNTVKDMIFYGKDDLNDLF